jgi:hypothetical protein
MSRGAILGSLPAVVSSRIGLIDLPIPEKTHGCSNRIHGSMRLLLELFRPRLTPTSWHIRSGRGADIVMQSCAKRRRLPKSFFCQRPMPQIQRCEQENKSQEGQRQTACWRAPPPPRLSFHDTRELDSRVIILALLRFRWISGRDR